MDLKLLKMLCKYSKQHHVMLHELYSVSSLLCTAQNVRFEIPYEVLYFETPVLIIFKYYAWASYDLVYAKDTFIPELIMFSPFSACSAYSFALLSNTNEISISSLILQE